MLLDALKKSVGREDLVAGLRGLPLANISILEYSKVCMEMALRALAHPARTSILRAVVQHERSVGELARIVSLRQPAVSQHLSVLRDANLVSVRAEGNQRWYRANPEELARLRAHLEGFWQESLGALEAAAKKRTRQGSGHV